MIARHLFDVKRCIVLPYTVKQVARDTHNLVVPLPDLHFGITTSMLDVKGHLDRLLELINKGYKTIVIEQLGDLFHSSQMWSSQTLKGTLVDEVNMVQAVEDAKQFFDVLVTAALQNNTVESIFCMPLFDSHFQPPIAVIILLERRGLD